jgi:hypothetical protein
MKLLTIAKKHPEVLLGSLKSKEQIAWTADARR